MRIKLDIPLTLAEIADAVGGRLNVPSTAVTHISTDSRITESKDLFFALQGENTDATQFMSNVKDIGAFTVGIDGDISIKDTAHALLALASHYKSKLLNLRHTVAITGSVGKSTTKEILASILSDQYKVHKTPDNFNNILGVSYSILSTPADSEILILELGMNHKGEIEELSKASTPDMAVITNVGTSHIGNLGSRKDIALAKLEIKAGLQGSLVVPDGEPLFSKESAYRFSTTSRTANLYVKRNEEIAYVYDVYENGNLRPYKFRADAYHVAQNASAAFSIAELCGFSPKSEYDFTAKSFNNTRQTLIKAKSVDILCDYYNASLESFMSGFKYAASLEYEHKSALIGDVLELGDYTAPIHFEIGKAAVEFGFERLYIFGNFAKYVTLGATSAGLDKKRIYINNDVSSPEITAEQILSESINGELIYAKASHKLDLGRITDLLKEEKCQKQ